MDVLKFIRDNPPSKKAFKTAAGLVAFAGLSGYLIRTIQTTHIDFERAHIEGRQLLKARGIELDEKKW